jgi:AcrR family transcriptional regulator
MAQAAEARAVRRRETEERLLDAALTVFVAHGYDAATTAEMARVADVSVGTFYLYFRDKRAAYERLARRAAQDLLARWRTAMDADMALPERVVRGLRLAAEFWRSDLARARLLLEGGPSFGSEGHLRFVDEIAGVLEASAPRRPLPARPLALVLAGLGIEIGRVIVADPAAAADVEQLIALVRRSLTRAGLTTRPGARR